MIRLLLVALAALAAAVAIALVAAGDPGYVLIARAPWQIEISLTLFLVLALLLGVTVHLALRFAHRLWRVPGDITAWQQRRRGERGLQALENGVLQLIEGRWERAERELAGHAVNSPSPTLSRLAAAYAAHRRGDLPQRDRYLEMAVRAEASSQRRFALALVRVRFQIQAGQVEEGLAGLETLQREHPRDPHVLGLLVEVRRSLGDWEGLTRMLPSLPRDALGERSAGELEREAWRQRLLAADTPEALERLWREVPPRARRDTAVVETYARALLAQGLGDEAENAIRDALGRGWHGGLLELYGRVRASDPSIQLSTAEDWLARHPDDPLLLLTLGRLGAVNELWGKARGYFERSIGLGGPPDAYRELGALLERLGEKELAMETYRRGLQPRAGAAAVAVARQG